MSSTSLFDVSGRDFRICESLGRIDARLAMSAFEGKSKMDKHVTREWVLPNHRRISPNMLCKA